MSDDKIITFAPKVRTRPAGSSDQLVRAEGTAERFRVLSPAVRDLRDRGVSKNDTAQTLRIIANELDGGGGRTPA